MTAEIRSRHLSCHNTTCSTSSPPSTAQCLSTPHLASIRRLSRRQEPIDGETTGDFAIARERNMCASVWYLCIVLCLGMVHLQFQQPRLRDSVVTPLSGYDGSTALDAESYDPAQVESQIPTATVCKTQLFDDRMPKDYATTLIRESQSYNTSTKFRNKISEADAQWNNRLIRHIGRFGAIHKFLHLLLRDKPQSDVLEMGFGAGTNMIVAHEYMGGRGSVWGIELTQGWVDHANTHFQDDNLHFLQGDISDAAVVLTAATVKKFDLIFLADVWEHIPSYRLKKLWESIVFLLKPSGRLYVHIPNELKQKAEQSNKGGQFFEEIVSIDVFRRQAGCFGMQILQIEEESLGYVSIVVGFQNVSTTIQVSEWG